MVLSRLYGDAILFSTALPIIAYIMVLSFYSIFFDYIEWNLSFICIFEKHTSRKQQQQGIEEEQ